MARKKKIRVQPKDPIKNIGPQYPKGIWRDNISQKDWSKRQDISRRRREMRREHMSPYEQSNWSQYWEKRFNKRRS